jgi:hypothetical protein
VKARSNLFQQITRFANSVASSSSIQAHSSIRIDYRTVFQRKMGPRT